MAMKPLLTLVATTVFTWATVAVVVAAPAPPAGASFTSAQGVPFSLVLDGYLLTNPVARQVHVGQLLPGRHWVNITLPTPYGRPVQFRTSVWLQPGVETNYVLVMQPYGPRLQQVSAVALGRPLYGPGGSYTGNYNDAYPQQAPPIGQNGAYNDGYSQQAPLAGQNGAYNNYPPQPPTAGQNGAYGNYPQQTPPNRQSSPYNVPNAGSYPPQTQLDPTAGYQGAYPNATPQPAPAPDPTQPADGYDPNGLGVATAGSNLPPLPTNRVQTLTQELRAHPSDNARLGIAKQALAQHSVTAEELAQLLGTLNLDKGRIALAEFGYAHVSDPQNFSVIYEVFHLASSVDEVRQALGLPRE